MVEKIEIQFRNKYLINFIGITIFVSSILVFLMFFIGAWFERMTTSEILLMFAGLLFALVFGISLDFFRLYKKAILHFESEGIIIKAKIGYIPIRFDDIEYFVKDRFDEDSNKQEYILKKWNNKKYRIKGSLDLYDKIISHMFKDQDG